jgi:hypothetical protein
MLALVIGVALIFVAVFGFVSRRRWLWITAASLLAILVIVALIANFGGATTSVGALWS